MNYNTAAETIAVATGDLRHSGKQDIVTANQGANSISVLLNNGNGTFASAVNYPLGTGTEPDAVALGDLRGLNRLDIVTADFGNGMASVLLSNGDGTFQTATTIDLGQGQFSFPTGVTLADFNGDHKLDMAVTLSAVDKVAVLLGNGDGTFGTPTYLTLPSGSVPGSIASADLRHTGKQDIVTANNGSVDGTNGVTVFLGNGNGTFASPHSYNVGPEPQTVTIADINADTKPDIVVTNSNLNGGGTAGSVSILPGNGDGTFGTHLDVTAGTFPYGVAVGDFNSDNKLDLAVTNQGDNNVEVFQGNGDFTFQAGQTFPTDTAPSGVAVADFNTDNKPDIVTANLFGNGQAGDVTVLLNTSGTTGTAPVVTAASDQNAVEGTSKNISLGSFSDPSNGPWTVTVTWGDGSTPTNFNPNAQGTLGTQPHTYGEEGTYTVTVAVQDTGDNMSGSAMFHVTVSDPNVAATAGLTFTPAEGSALPTQTVATFTDPGGAEPNPADPNPTSLSGHYSASINWGDNNTTPGTITLNGTTFTIMGGHTYGEEGTYNIVVTINHENSTPQVVSDTASVSDPNVAASGGLTLASIAEGAALSSVTVATFTDPAGAEPNAADSTPTSISGHYSASINWGDSTPASTGTITLNGTTFTVQGSHTYADEGSYTITVTIGHENSTPQTVTDTISVSNPPVVATGGLTFNATEGVASAVQPVATFTDPGGAEAIGDYSATINWGDSSPATTGTITLNGTTFTVSGSHAYTEEGSFTITVTVNHEGTTPSTVTSTAAVADANVVASGNLTFNASEGTPSTTQNVATFTDPGGPEVLGDYSASINWGDNTAATPGTITLNGTTFTVSGSHTYAEEGNFTITVTINHDTSTPQTVTDTASVANPSVVASGGLSLTGSEGTSLGTKTVASFTDPGGPEAIGDYSASINWGDGTTATAGTITVAGTTFTVSGSHTYGEEGNYTITVTVSHESTTAQTVTDTATISDPPVSASGVPLNAGVNSSTTATVATFTDPAGAEPNASDPTPTSISGHYSATINWGDGTPTSTGTITLNNGVFTVTGTHTYATVNTFTITTTINHEGATPQTVTSTASVAMGIPPTVTAPGSQSSAEGMSQSFNLGSFTDPDGGPWSVDVNWGDSSPHTTFPESTPGSLGSQPHTYAEEGTYTVTVTVKDTFDGQTGSGMFTVSVSNPSVVATGGLTFTASENTASAVQPVATFTDPGGPESLSDYSATINWGDSTPATAGTITQNGTTFTVSGSHTYTEEGNIPITVTINHEGTTPATATSTAAVADVNVVATGGFSFTGTEGVVSTTQTLATFTDPAGAEANDGTHYTATINWGDGSTPSTGTISFAGGIFTVSGSHAYAEEGNFNVTVTINHESSTPQTAISTATIANPNVVATGGFSITGSEGSASATQTVATFTDPAGAEGVGDYSASINWGDGTAATAGTITGTGTTFSVTGSHLYGEEGKYTLTVTINHENSTAQAVTSTATISDPAVVGKPISIFFNPGVAFNGAIATFTDPAGAEPNASDPTPNTISGHYTATINWGDGTPTSTGTITLSNGVFTVNGTHTYGGGATFTITTQINHEGVITPISSSAMIASTGIPRRTDQTKPVNWWAGSLGQELIRRFGLTSGGQTLGQWLATNFPNLYGGANGAPNLSNFTNSQIGIFYMGLFNQQNMLKVDAEVMATALAVFATTQSLGGNVGQFYGFFVDSFGLGAYTWNIGFNGPAMGVPNFTVETVFQILAAANKFAVNGEPWGTNNTLRNQGYSVFSGINGG